MEHTCLYTKNHVGASGVLKEGLEGACVKTVYVARLRGSKILLFLKMRNLDYLVTRLLSSRLENIKNIKKIYPI